MSKMASTSSSPRRRRASTATSLPSMKSSTSSDCRPPLDEQPATMAATRRKTEGNTFALSARTTPWLPDRSSGFTTHGYRSVGAKASGSASMAMTMKRGVSRPAARNRSRIRALSRAASTASSGLCAMPSAAAADAASSVPPSSTATTESNDRVWENSTIRAVDRSMSWKSSRRCRPSIRPASAGRCSEPTTTSIPRRDAAAMKSCVR